MNALLELLFSEYDSNELPAHVFLHSVHNVSIERSWLRLRLEVGDNAVIAFEKGIEDGIYRVSDPAH